MKVLRYLLWFPFVVMALLLILALAFPKVEIESAYVIYAPVDISWNFFQDKSKTHLWMTNYTRLQVIEETPNKVGSKYILYFKVDENDMMMNQTITNYEINKNYGFVVENAGANSYNNINFIKNENNSTTIKQKTLIKPTSFYFRPFLPIMKIAMNKQTKKNYTALKKLIEKEVQP